jgi:predicted Zn-dependent protease
VRRLRAPLAVALVVLTAFIGVAHALGTEDERELGRKFFLAARSELPLVQDPAVTEYVEGLGARIVKTLGPQAYDYHFYTVQSPSLNAFAVPGGYIFMFTGLIAKVDNDDELVGVLAHETGHVAGHHAVRQQAQGQAWNYAALLGALLSAVNPVLGAGAIAAAQTAQLKYSREFEQEADFLGLRYATEAGYDPHALASFFKQLLVEQRINPAGVPPYMLTHPLTENRVANVDTIIATEKLKAPPGRPAASPELAEVKAVTQALGEPPDVVIERYKRLADEKPNDAQRQFLLGRVYQTVGQLDAARGALERSRELGISPDRVDRPLGTVYVALKQPDKARETLERRLASHPSDAFAHLELGKALAASDPAAALREYQRALGLNPDLDEAHRLAGMALGRQGDQVEGFYHLAQAALLRGELEQALSHFRRTDELLPKGSPREIEVAKTIEELEPLVRERERERMERRRRGFGS